SRKPRRRADTQPTGASWRTSAQRGGPGDLAGGRDAAHAEHHAVIADAVHRVAALAALDALLLVAAAVVVNHRRGRGGAQRQRPPLAGGVAHREAEPLDVRGVGARAAPTNGRLATGAGGAGEARRRRAAGQG